MGRKKLPAEWHLRLYIAGETSRSKRALEELIKLCEAHLAGRYHIDVIDLRKTPHLAAGEQIVATPTLVRKLPAPLRTLIGDLGSIDRVLVGLDLKKAR